MSADFDAANEILDRFSPSVKYFISDAVSRPNRLRFVLPISRHVTILLGGANCANFPLMVQRCLARNMLEKSKDNLHRD